MNHRDDILYLFSSNIRPLYEQDILDLLAAPRGQLYQFRYDEEYIAAGTLREWEKLQGRTALVHFSLQQEAEYQPAAFFPVRKGQISRTFSLGSVAVVEFTLDDYVTLREPPIGERNRLRLSVSVDAYSDYLKQRDIPRPYEYSAGLGANIFADKNAPLDTTSDEARLFARSAVFLAPTQSF
jgi:hypothetical protein